MENHNECKKIDVKNHTSYYFDDIINSCDSRWVYQKI